MINLSKKQKEIVNFEKGPILVLASAGSGKTRVLTERIRYLATITRRQILAITFTNKASDEIKNRLQDIDNLEDKTYIGTFHSFCSSIIEKHGSAIGYLESPHIFSDENDRKKIIEEIILQNPILKNNYENKNDSDKNKILSSALDIISKIKRNVILDDKLKDVGLKDFYIQIYLNYRDMMKSLNAVDYDDLLFLVYKLFITKPNIAGIYRRNFEYICIDEAQDLNKAQYMVLKALTGDENKNVMLVGDPKQSIFGFNGSRSKFMTEDYKNDYNPTIFELTENYRSSRKVLEFANKLIPNSSEITDNMVDGQCSLLSYETPEDEANAITEKIKELLTTKNLPDIDEEITYDKIAIIARNKYVLKDVEESLIEKKIPYHYKNSIKGVIFDSNYGKIFDLALQVKLNPKDTLHLEELTLLLGEKTVSNIQILSDSIDDKIANFILKQVISLEEDCSNFRKNVNEIIDYIKNESRSNTSEEYTLEEYNISLLDFIMMYESYGKYASSNSAKSLSHFRNSLALGQNISKEEENGIVLSTVHTMKGQESEIIFLIGVDNLTFPDYRAVKKGGFVLEQEKNDMYVAITRAKRYLYISYPKTRIMPWGDKSKRTISTFLRFDENNI